MAARKPQVTRKAVDPALPKRGRPPKIDSEQVLNVAREVFLESGIRATTLEVAQRAGISEGAVFHRFKSKGELFRAAMKLPEEEVPRRLVAALEELDEHDVEEGLRRMASALLEIGRIALPLMMMSWSNPGLCTGTPYDQNRAEFQEFVKKFAGYFESQMARGRLRRMDAELLARAFLGALHHYCMTRIVSGDAEPTIIPEGMFTRGLVDLLLRGALAEPRETPSAFATRNRTS